MKKRLIMFLICLIFSNLISCSAKTKSSKQENNIDIAFGDNIEKKDKNISVNKLKELYQVQGLKNVKTIGEIAGFKHLILEDSQNHNSINIFGNDNVVRSFISCIVDKSNLDIFKSLSDILFSNLIPNFDNYDRWLNSIILSCINNPEKQFFWVKDGMEIRISFSKKNSKNNTLIIDIIDMKQRPHFPNPSGTSIIELDNNGNVPNDIKNNYKNLSNHQLYDDVFCKITSGASFENVISLLEESNIKYKIQEYSEGPASIIVNATDNDKDSLEIHFKQYEILRVKSVSYLRYSNEILYAGSVFFEGGISFSGPFGEQLKNYKSLKALLFSYN